MNDKVPPSLNRFAAELEDAIRRELGARRDGRLVHMLRARPRLLAGTTVGAAVTATVLALALSAAGTTPAFAVTRHHDGSYSVTLRSLKAIRAANLKLSQMGVPVHLIQVPPMCALAPKANARVHALWSVRIDPRKIRPGRTLVIGAWRHGNQVAIAPALSIHGAARGCALLPCPPATLPTGNQKQVPVTVTPLSGAAGKSGKPSKGGSPRALWRRTAPLRIKCPGVALPG